MGKVAFIFSGQGDQYPGMGRELYEQEPEARRIFDLCESIRPGTLTQCFRGTEGELKETQNTQPCLFAMEAAAAGVLAQRGIVSQAVAGFSLGEVAAAAFGGVFDLETGFRLVCRRGELMQREAEKFDTSMAAVVKLTAEQVEAVCARYSGVYPVNYNCPGQITVSGLSDRMADFFADVRAAGGRALPLKVKGGFHSPFMKAAAKKFAEELMAAELKKPGTVLYSNMTAEPYGDDPAQLLAAQICHPVRWEAIIRSMMAGGIDTFVEIGPGRTLTNMVRRISTEVRAVNYTEYLTEVAEC